jgi:hypothetical protein
MYILPTLNPDDPLEYSWAEWLIEHQKLYSQGKLNDEQKKQMENLANIYQFELQTFSNNNFQNNFQNFIEYMKTRQTN